MKMHEKTVQDIKRGEPVTFSSMGLPHEIQVVEGEIYLATDWNVVIIPKEVADTIAVVVEEGMLSVDHR